MHTHTHVIHTLTRAHTSHTFIHIHAYVTLTFHANTHITNSQMSHRLTHVTHITNSNIHDILTLTSSRHTIANIKDTEQKGIVRLMTYWEALMNFG